MTNKEKLEMNKIGLIEEYKHLNDMRPFTMEISNRMSDIYLILLKKYNFDITL